MAVIGIKELLKDTVLSKASDLHLSSGMPPIKRWNGDLKLFEADVLTNESLTEMLKIIINPEQWKIFETTKELDCSFAVEGLARFRINVFQQARGVSAVLRVIPAKIASLEELKAPESFVDIASLPKGLILVTGPTGSGKSTTLAAMINYINCTRGEHIITIEDPIEFFHTSKQSLVSQRELHANTLSFDAALRAALREDPDVILVGELRDLESIRLALTAAETGHLVFATLHTSSAPQTIDRIIDVFPAGEKDMVRAMLSEALQAVIAQTLLPNKDGNGRVALHEIMVVNSAIRNLIREAKISQIYSVMQTSRGRGMQTLDQALSEAVKKEVILREDAVEVAINKDNFQ